MEPTRIIAYVDPITASAGDVLHVKVSCEEGSHYVAQLVRLISGDPRPRGTGFEAVDVDSTFAGRYPARPQALAMGSYATLGDFDAFPHLTFACFVRPTTPARERQAIVAGPGLELRVAADRFCLDVGDIRVALDPPVVANRWHEVHCAVGPTTVTLRQRVFGQGVGEPTQTFAEASVSRSTSEPAAAQGPWFLAADGHGTPGFNGRIEAPRLIAATLSADAVSALLNADDPRHPSLMAAWDFAREISSDQVIDVSGNGRHGLLHQCPTRAVTGTRWNGNVTRWQEDPSHYGAIHFHEDDIVDAGWDDDFTWTLPPDLPSGVYGIKLTSETCEDYCPVFVRPSPNQPRAAIAFLASTATYLAYANQRVAFTGLIGRGRGPRDPLEAYLLAHPELGGSLYEHHVDGSGVHFSSRLRPVVNLKPKTLTWSFNADMNIVRWLEHAPAPFDVITDEDLHREGHALLDDYQVVVTGAHPEYYSTPMHDALTGWLERGGRLMYMGGNGFYWRIAHHPTRPGIIEVRRAEDGTRAWAAEPGEYHHAFTGEYGGLWRRLGRPPNQVVGVGFAAQGFDGGTHYRLRLGAQDPRAAFIMNGVLTTDVLGDFGTQGGGAAGEEIDRYDPSLGSPTHALVLATSEGHKPGMLRVKEEFLMTRPLGDDPDVRADMVFFETPSGGAVFSTGSISFAGSLAHDGYDNDVARIANNVLSRFADATPFDFPGATE